MRYSVLLAILMAATVPAMAADVYECGFENEQGYAPDWLDGQQDWAADLDVYVQSVSIYAGEQAMTVEADGNFDATFHWSADRTFPDHRALSNVVTFSQAINISVLGEADWLIQLCDFDEELVTNYIHFTFDGYIDFNETVVGTFAPATWMVLTLTMDFDTQTVTVSLDDDVLVEDAPFFNAASKFDQVIYATDDYYENEINYMDVDDLLVVTPAGLPAFHMEILQNENWVYQNTVLTMSNNGHYLDLQAVVDDVNGNNSVSLAIEKIPGSGTGEVTITPHPELENCWRIYGSMRNEAAELEGCGDLTLRATCTGDVAGQTTADVALVCRTTGDLNGDGGVEPSDTSLLIAALNAMAPPGYTDRTFDLDANGGAEPGDLSILINVLNKLPIQ